MRHNHALNLAPFGRWALRDKAAQRRLAPRWALGLELSAVFIVAGCTSTDDLYTGPYGTIGELPGQVSLQIVRDADSGPGAWRLLRNDSQVPVVLERYAGRSPVAYCGRDQSSVRMCSDNADSGLAAQAVELRPKVTVGFLAMAQEGEKVAVKIQVNGKWQYLWEETSVALQQDK